MSARRLVPAFWLAFMLYGIWYGAEKLSVRNDLSDLLPEGATETQRILLSQVRKGLSGRLILLAVEGASPAELAGLSRSLAESLRTDERIGMVANGTEVRSKKELALLSEFRYLLSPTVTEDTFSESSLRAALEQRLHDLRSPLGAVIKESIPTDPTGETWNLLRSWSMGEGPSTYGGVWMSPDRARALLLVEARGSGFDVDEQESLHRAIRASFGEAVKKIGSAAQLRMSGPSVFAVEAQRSIEAEAWRLTAVASGLVVSLLFVSYRSLVLVLLTLIPISTGIVAGVIAVNHWFGFVHGITLGFGVILLGVVDDYPIHLFSHLTGRESPSSTVQAIWPTMRLGMLTTVIGFSSLLLSGYQALAQLGLLAIVGLITGALATRWVVPACIGTGFVPIEIRTPVQGWLDRLSKGLVPAAVVLILAVAVLVWSDTPMWEQDVGRLSPLPEEKKQLDQQLRKELGAPDVRDLLVIEEATIEDLLEKAEAVTERLEGLRAHGLVKGYDIVSRYVPSRRTQLARQRALPDRPTLERNLKAALEGLPFTPGLFEPFVEAVEAARRDEPIGPEVFAGTMLGIKLESLLFPQGGRWMAVAPLNGVGDRTSLAGHVEQWGDESVRYLDLKEESNRIMTAYRDRTAQLLGWGMAAIAVVLAVGLRSAVLVVRVLTPVLCALLVVAAVLRGLGEPLSLFHVATFLLVVGLGLDYALFLNRPECTGEERLRTSFGLLVCSGTTMLVFGVLAFSKTPALHAIGLTAASGSLCCLAFSAVTARREGHAV
ncbi:MAG: MMPL family transporter [Nitrospira sp.]|nr:MMPL family transporter [Nitrospira sp.]